MIKQAPYLQLITFLILLGLCPVLASAVDCPDLDKNTRDIGWHRPYIGYVYGRGRAQLYSAPSKSCAVKGKFLIQGDTAMVYSTHKGWVQLLYDGANGDFMGWIRAERINIGHDHLLPDPDLLK